MMRVAIVSSEYPGPDLIYGDTFVHSRVRLYKEYCEVMVVGYHADLTHDRIFEFEGVNAYITSDLTTFIQKLREFDPDVLAVHFINYKQIRELQSLRKPLIIFVHGYEALSWKRRLMNYRTLGDLRYFLPYFLSNRKQIRAMKALAKESNQEGNYQFVFVSQWLRKAVESDWKMKIKNYHVVPNGIDTQLFKFQRKPPELRKRILLLRSFKARNYANDLAIDAILLLSKKEFFNDLEFSIFGEGFLFSTLTGKIEQFSNVRLNNFFVENKSIPEIHAKHGIFLCPSRLDTQGVSMCEAMSSGLVPITSAIGGIPEYATDEFSSFQVTTPYEIAEKISFLYHNPDEFLKMSARASQEIADKCSLLRTVKSEIDIFNQ